MFVGILLRDPARDFGVEFESLCHREIFEISARGQKTIGSHLNLSDLLFAVFVVFLVLAYFFLDLLASFCSSVNPGEINC